MRHLTKPLILCLTTLALVGLSLGCHRSDQHTQNGSHSHSGSGAHTHHHEPPHGGTAVVLGAEAYHLEFILDPMAGQLTCYVLDGHMEQFVRIGSQHLELEITLENATTSVTLSAVANRATGETVGDSSQFDGQTDALKAASSFDAVLKEIVIRGKSYMNVGFGFPEGNE